MSGTSLRPGFLRPVTTLPDEDDDALDAVMQAWMVGLTGLPGAMVRPRWQPAPPPSPDQNIDWCAIGALGSEFDTYSWLGHNADGTSTMHRHEALDCLATFYGPNAARNARLARDNAQVGQNRDLLTAHDIQLTEIGQTRNVPELTNQIWRGRADLPFMLRRQVSRIYPIRTLVDAPLWLRNDFDALPSLYPTLLDDPVLFRRLIAANDAHADASCELGLSKLYAAMAASEAAATLS